ncbi:MAG: uncharacterized protein K0S76_2792 [Herbinix sp.]|jgi:hypothetical protein|nr:uncharacterized protein [Herbinix sp.]
MYELKTKVNDCNVIDFINSIESESKREDTYQLLDIFTETTGFPAKMWGDNMIGFGSYHYKYATGHEGDAMLVGFSPRKAKMSLYMATGDADREKILKDLGKHTAGKACVYINKLSDINVEILKDMINQSVAFLKKTYE